MSYILLVKILTHPIASAMLCPSLLVERGEAPEYSGAWGE